MNNRIAASKLDDKIACAILIQTLLELQNITPLCDLYFVFTAQDEIGPRGAKTAAQAIAPDYSIALGVSMAGDTPECGPAALKVGFGAAVKIMDGSVICHRDMINLFLKTARDKNIPHQPDISARSAKDTAAAMQTAGEGSAAGAISVPARYRHTGVELCSMDDASACADLLKYSLEAIMREDF
jgi:endoglucanase